MVNHPFFYLSIAAVAPFYCILFLSFIRDIIRSYGASGSGSDKTKTPKKPDSLSGKNSLNFTSIFLAHWVMSESPTPFTFVMNPLARHSGN